jgi:hypothetical protein
LLAKVKSTRASFIGFFEVGVGLLFWKSSAEKEAHSTRVPSRYLRVMRLWWPPMAAKDLLWRRRANTLLRLMR